MIPFKADYSYNHLWSAWIVQAVEDMCLHKMADRLYAGLQQVHLEGTAAEQHHS